MYNSNFHYFSRVGWKEKISREESRSEGFAPKTREGSKGSHGRSHDRAALLDRAVGAGGATFVSFEPGLEPGLSLFWN